MEPADQKVIEILKKVGAIITNDHFLLTSGLHSSTYINKDALYPHTTEASKIGYLIAKRHLGKGIEIVVGPALGGIILSQWTAYHLTQLEEKEILGQFSEKTADKRQILTRGYDKLIKGKKILVVEDITTTGGSVKKVVDSVRKVGGEVVAVCVMINRDPERVHSALFGAPYESLAIFEAEAYDPAVCPMCKAGTPFNKDIGHAKNVPKPPTPSL